MNHYCKAGSFTTKVRICCQLRAHIFLIMVRSEQNTVSVISQCAATCTAVVVASNIDDDV